MPRDYKQQLTIDEIMRLIRQEAARNKAVDCNYNHNIALPVPDTLSHVQLRRETAIWKLMKKIQYALRFFPFYNAFYRIAIRFRDYIPRYRDN